VNRNTGCEIEDERMMKGTVLQVNDLAEVVFARNRKDPSLTPFG